MEPRPSSLAEIARRAADATAFECELSDFLHEFAFRGDAAMLAEPPILLRDRFALGAICDAYLAAVAVSLFRHGFVAPRRCGRARRSAACTSLGSPAQAATCALCSCWKVQPPFVSGTCLSLQMRFRLHRPRAHDA